MSEISIAHLHFRLSGGAANTDPDASLGGVRSSERVYSQSTTGLTDVTGVTIEYAAGNAEGAGTLAFDIETTSLTWTPNGGTAGAAVDVSEGGLFTIRAGADAGLLLVDVTPSALPIGDESDSITVANIANELFDDVSKAESFAGDVEYRCIYVTNTHPTDSFLDVIAWIAGQPTPGTLALALDPAPMGSGAVGSVVGITRSGTTATVEQTSHGHVDGSTITFAGADQAAYNVAAVITVTDPDHYTYTVSGSPTTPATGTITASSGVSQTVANENTAPTGVTFSSPSSSSTGISLGEIPPGKSRALWVRRTIAARNTTSNDESTGQIALQAYF